MSSRFILVANSRSGSFDRDLVDELLQRAGQRGLGLPVPWMLDGEQEFRFPEPGTAGPEDIVAVFGGDGTIGSAMRNLTGWDGQMLVLPGGTMNLASKRLHGEADALAIVEAVAAGRARPERPTVIRTGQGDSLAGVMVGPGTSWSDVREALRDLAIIDLAASAVRAFATTGTGARVACVAPPVGRTEGYPMIEVLPTAGGMELSGYHADDLGQFAVGLAALLRHDFRTGPHESFELEGSINLAAVDGGPVGMLIDGDAVDECENVVLTVGSSAVDLLVTAPDA